MKKSMKHTLVIAAAAMSLLACTKEIQQPVQPAGEDGSEGMYTYQFVLDGETKTALDGNHLAWEAGDRLGAYVRAGEDVSVNQASEVDVTATPVKVGIHSTVAITAGAGLYAYFPYVSPNGGTPENVTLTIPTAQVQAGTAFDSDAMPLASVPVTATKDLGEETELALRMVGLGSLVCFNLYSTDGAIATEKVTRVTFAADKAVAGDFTYDLTSVSYDETEEVLDVPVPDGFEDTEVSTAVSGNLAVGSSKAAGAKVYMVLAPVSAGGTIRVYTDNATRSYKLTVPEISFSRNATRTFNIDLANAQIVSTENGIWSADDLLAASAALNAGESVSKYLVDGKLTLMADLNMKNLAWEPFDSLTVSFDGNGHSLKNWTTSAPLCAVVASGVTVSDLTIDASCAYNVKTGTQSGTGQMPGFVASSNHGILSGIDSYGTVSMTNGTNYRWIGAIAALSDGTISHCSNHGDFSLRNSASLRVGGIVGQVQGGSVSNCTNAGDLNITACSYACFGGIVGRIQSGTSASVSQAENSGALSAVSNLTTDENEIGGIVGSSTINLTLSDATNKGTITFSRSNLDINVADNIGGVLGHNSASASTLTRVFNDTGADISATINRGSVGGVVGWGKGAAVGTAWNKGNIEVSGNSSNNTRSGIGGVVGTGNKNLTDCDNYGTVTVSSESATYRPYVGGVCGAMEAAVTLSNCFNRASGTMNIDIAYFTYAGGVLGYGQGCSVSGSQNLADITVSDCTYMNLGGIAGFIETAAFAISNVENNGSFNLTSSSTTQSGIAGILGKAGKAVTLSDATNKGDILFVKQTRGGNHSDNIGGIVGEITTTGSSANRVYNEGDIDVTIARGSVGGITAWGADIAIQTAWNKGAITVSADTDAAAARSGIGGIAGTLSKEISDVENYGEIRVEGVNKYYPQVGGIRGAVEGGSASTNIHNYASITVTAPGDMASVGGIDGYHKSSYHVNNSSNSGDITLTSSASTNYVGGIYGGFNGQVNSGTNTGNIILNSSNSASVNHIGGLAGQKGAANANGTATGNLTFNYTGNQAFAGKVNAAHAIGYHSGANHNYYGTFGGTLTINNASSGTLNCGMLIGLIDGTSGATLGASGKTLTFYNNATVNGISPSADSADDNYYAGEAFLIGSKTTTGTVTVNPAYISLVSPN